MIKHRIKYANCKGWAILEDDKKFVGIVWKDKDYPKDCRWCWMTMGEYWNWGHGETMKEAINNMNTYVNRY